MIAKTPDDCEWYTPSDLLEQVYDVMEIDLDPASPETPIVKAKNHYSKKENGLANSWDGNIFLNPPYGRDIKIWIEKLCTEWDLANINNAITLIPAKTDTQWFHLLAKYAVCFCTIEGRLKFTPAYDRKTTAGTFANILVLLSYDQQIIDKFIKTFSKRGFIWEHV